jgi:hypothetical protein
MIVFRKGFRLPVVPREVNSIPVADRSHCIKGATAIAESDTYLERFPEDARSFTCRHPAEKLLLEGSRVSHLKEVASCCAVNPQHFDELCNLAQVAEGVAGGLVVAAEEVYVEDVFPGASA